MKKGRFTLLFFTLALMSAVTARGGILSWNTFLGGSADDIGCALALDSSGNIYVVGYCNATWGSPIRPYAGNNYDAFVAKLSPTGSLIWNTFLGGPVNDYGYAIGLDASGNIYVFGQSNGTWETPVRAFSGISDAFVAKLSSAGVLQWNTFLGGSDSDNANGLTVISSGDVFVTGSSKTSWGAPGNPFVGGPGYADIFVAKLNGSGALQWNTFLGGDQIDTGYGVACDASGDVYIAGSSKSTWGSPLRPFTGWYDGFAAKLSGGTGALQWNTFLGQSVGDDAYAVSLDVAGNVYVGGYSDGTWGSPLNPYAGGAADAFLAKLNGSGALQWNTFLGGSGADSMSGVAVARDGTIYLTGYSTTTWGSPDNPLRGTGDAFAAKVNAAGALQWNTFLGGLLEDYGTSLAIDGNRNIYLTGYSSLTWGSPIRPYTNPYDAFVVKITITSETLSRHAVGDFDADNQDEAAVDFGTMGIWMFNSGAWGQIGPADPEMLAAADIDGNNDDEIVADLGSLGLWLWNGGSWIQISGTDVEGLAAGDVDADGSDEIIADFGPTGLWLYDGGGWTQLSAVNVDYAAVAELDGAGGKDIIGDFGTTGLWKWQAGTWTQLSGVNADFFARGNTDGAGAEEIAGDFGATGLWLWNAGAWTQLSGVNANYLVMADIDADGRAEIIGDFGSVGLWLWDGGSWTMLSGMRQDYMIAANLDADPAREAVVDFGPIGLWLNDAGAWTQVSGVNADYLISGDFDGDLQHELMVDFASLGLWVYNGGAWTQVSGVNSD